MNWGIKKRRPRRERYTHYPVPSEVKVSKKLERTSGSRDDFIFACTKAMNRSKGSICQIISDIKSISSEKGNASEQVASTRVDVVLLLHHRDHDRLSAE